MQPLDPHSTHVLVAVVLVALIAVAGWFAHQRRQSHRLEQRFGNEYHRMLDQMGSRGKAEAELRQREKRVEKLTLVALSNDEALHFRDSWRAVQARFVDDPKGAMAEADRLVRELMFKRGYPMGDFERRAADISVDHPRVVENYRAAHDIARRVADGKADTEAMRKAVVHYRALFDDLLEVERPADKEVPR
jgi:hypothetical protein